MFVREIVYVTSAPAGTVSCWKLSHANVTPRRATRSRARFSGSGRPVRTSSVDFRYSTASPFSTSDTRAVTEYAEGGRTSWKAPIASDRMRTSPGPENVRSAETRTSPLYVVTPETVNAGTRERLSVVSWPGDTVSVPRKADPSPEETAWTLYDPG